MKKMNFLILTEGSTDILSVRDYIERNFNRLLLMKLEEYPELIEKFGDELLIKTSLKREVVLDDVEELKITLPVYDVKKSKKQNVTIYIKNSTNQNISNFIREMKDFSPKKMYGLDNIYQTYSVFDSDLGSTTKVQIKKYYEMEDINSILNFPCLESLYFQENYTELFNNRQKIYEKNSELEDIIIINQNSIFVKNANNASNSQYIKTYSKELGYVSSNSLENNFEYIRKNINDYCESWEIIDGGNDIYINNILKGKNSLVVSFIPIILENIIDLIIGVEE